MMSEGFSPEEYMARHGRNILVWSSARHEYQDPEVNEWAHHAAYVLFDSDRLAEAEDKHLSGTELEEKQRRRAKQNRSHERWKMRHRSQLSAKEETNDRP